jgi:uroporphyrin-III C-methyltransferase
MSGFVHLVGAGPGDPELITLKGARLLAEADAIVHDRLVHPTLLESARPDAIRFDVGKEGHGTSVPQESTSELLVRLARSGLTVVRLKQGDPFVFGRGGEEVLALEEAGVPYEVVPGITAGLAGPAAAGIPVTHRGVARSVSFVTAATDTGLLDPSEWRNVALSDTIVVFMARHGATAAGQALLEAGRDSQTPVAVITDATRPDQDVRLIDIGGLASAGIGAPNGRPVLLVIGEVAAFAHEVRRIASAAAA